MTAIALDRLNAVTSRSRVINKAQNRRTVIKVVLINLISVLAILPYSLHMEVIKWAERETSHCKSLNYIKYSIKMVYTYSSKKRRSAEGAFDVIQLSFRKVRRVSLKRLGLGLWSMYSLGILNIFFLSVTFLSQWSLEDGEQSCVELWSGPARKIFGGFTFLFQFLLPSLVSAFAYVRIVIILQRHLVTQRGMSNKRLSY